MTGQILIQVSAIPWYIYLDPDLLFSLNFWNMMFSYLLKGSQSFWAPTFSSFSPDNYGCVANHTFLYNLLFTTLSFQSIAQVIILELYSLTHTLQVDNYDFSFLMYLSFWFWGWFVSLLPTPKESWNLMLTDLKLRATEKKKADENMFL